MLQSFLNSHFLFPKCHQDHSLCRLSLRSNAHERIISIVEFILKHDIPGWNIEILDFALLRDWEPSKHLVQEVIGMLLARYEL